MEKHSLNRYSLIILFLLLPNLLFAGAPSRTKTYTTGTVISAADVTENEDNLFRYVQTGVDTYADGSIVSADITDGTIVNADISGSAAITYGKLSFSNNIVAGDIATSAVDSAEINDNSIVNADINSSAAIAASKLTLTGITTFTAGGNLDIGSYELRAQTFNSDVVTGTAPLTVASTTKVTNLNADTTDGYEGGTGIPSNIQVFTSNGTWTKPANVGTVWVKAWGGGGGGGGGGAASNEGGGGGGGASGYSEGLVTVTGDVTVTVGAAGTGGVAETNGVAGGNSSFAGATTLTANGGALGSGTTTATAGAGGTGGTATNGTINLTGQAGRAGSPGDASQAFVSGGKGGLPNMGYGGGGDGGDGGGSTGRTGQDGQAGIVIVYY